MTVAELLDRMSSYEIAEWRVELQQRAAEAKIEADKRRFRAKR